jgi:hypothetical protein
MYCAVAPVFAMKINSLMQSASAHFSYQTGAAIAQPGVASPSEHGKFESCDLQVIKPRGKKKPTEVGSQEKRTGQGVT